MARHDKIDHLNEKSADNEQQFISDVAMLYKKEMYNAASAIYDTSKTINMFTTDDSFFLGDYLAMVRPACLTHWMLDSSLFAAKFGIRYTRIIQMATTPPKTEDIPKIKYCLHTLMSLGHKILIVFSDNKMFLQNNFGSTNNLTVGRLLSIDLPDIWCANKNRQYITDCVKIRKKTDVVDAFMQLKSSQPMRERTIHMEYGEWSYNVSRAKSFNSVYSEFLHFIQDGKCGISGDALTDAFDVDHIWPSSKGGQNTIINAQAVNKLPNKEKGNATDGCAKRILNDNDLACAGLSRDLIYTELTKRIDATNPFSLHPWRHF